MKLNSAIEQSIQQLGLLLPSPMQNIKWPSIKSDGNFENHPTISPSAYRVLCKRDDLIHPAISGNKWRKLSAFMEQILDPNCQHLLSFGGGHSNHLHALAFLCFSLNKKFTAIVRGNYHAHPTSTLIDILKWGANVEYVTKIDYKRRSDKDFLQHLYHKFRPQLIIPEGGSQQGKLDGIKNLVEECLQQSPNATHIILPVASGGTMAGLINYLQQTKGELSRPIEIIGIAVLKGQDYLEKLIDDLLATPMQNTSQVQWRIIHQYHFGGYAKSSSELNNFMRYFTMQTSIPLEPVYSGKCFYAANSLIRQQVFAENSEIIVLHTGGLPNSREYN